jgi:hypothetical protein
MTAERRKVIALAIFVLDLLVCGTWAYREAASMIQKLSGTGSGGIAGVSAGYAELLVTLVPIVLAFVLARASGATRLATYWRDVHLAASLALVILPSMGGLTVMMVSIVVFLPVQAFFVVGAVAIWIASPRRQPDLPAKASS